MHYSGEHDNYEAYTPGELVGLDGAVVEYNGAGVSDSVSDPCQWAWLGRGQGGRGPNWREGHNVGGASWLDVIRGTG